ncbi:MAG: ribose 5-phosphate isomerase B [Thermoanaerobaculales bacterium]|nr:ribose 5-phosphate isomerase B [Thermoanaerobaculales bacterium]
MTTEQEVRRVVAQVVDEVLAGNGPSREAIAIGADHGGFRLKELLLEHLRSRGREVRDCGTSSTEAVDYPDFAHAVARLVAAGECRWGIVVDGAGIGSAMVANKVPGVRAALCYDLSTARNSREHNHANVLTLGAGLIGEALARGIVDEWLATEWGPGRHAARVAKITAVERCYASAGPAGEGG